MTDNSSTHNIHRQSGWRRAIPVFISLLILGMALHALSGHFTNHGYHQIRLAFKAFTTWQIVLTLVLGLCSYACLVGFDWIGLQRTGKRPHPARVAITAFLAHTIGQTLGFAALTGGAVRLRGYSKVGLSLIEIGQIVLMSTLGFIFGAWVLLGLALALEPATATPILPLDTLGIRSTGIALLAAFLVMLWLVNNNGREFGIGRQRFWIPDETHRARRHCTQYRRVRSSLRRILCAIAIRSEHKLLRLHRPMASCCCRRVDIHSAGWTGCLRMEHAQTSASHSA